MYARALQFKREFHYDFAQWGDPEKDFKAHGFLFNDDTGVFGHGAIVGACAFRWREPCARLGDAVGMDRAHPSVRSASQSSRPVQRSPGRRNLVFSNLAYASSFT